MLIFLYDNLQTQEIQEKMKLPLQFVSCGQLTGYKMYMYHKRLTITKEDFATNKRGVSNIYGTIWNLKEPSYYLRILDGYYGSSYSRIGENSPFDQTHRLTQATYPFSINSITDLITANFYTLTPLQCITWIANHKDDKLKRIVLTKRKRILCGCKTSYIENALNKHK